MRTLKVLVLFIVFISLILSGCSNDNTNLNTPDNESEIEDIIADPDFMFNTILTVALELKSFDNGNPVGNAYFELFDGMPHEGGNQLISGFTDDSGDFSFNISVPIHINKLILFNANRDFYEYTINRIDGETGLLSAVFESPYNSTTREAPAWEYDQTAYYATLFSKVYDENNNIYTDDVNDMFGIFIGNTCIGVTGGIYPGAVLLPDNSVLFTTVGYLPDDENYLVNMRYYDASANQVYLFDDWYDFSYGETYGNNQNPWEFYFGSWNMMPDPMLISCSSPGINQYGMLAFEDKWPQQGDYDINDLVVYGNFTYFVTDINDLVFTGNYEITYRVAAIGASYEIGFGIQLPEYFTLSNISSTNGLAYLEADSRTIIFANNVRDCIPQAAGDFINTEENSTYYETEFETVSFDFVVEYDYRSVFMPQWYEPPYNPFIYINGNRGHEIHPADYPPTALVEDIYWGTEDDTSDPDNWRYYRTENNMPWFFMLPIEAPYPKESCSVLDAYPYFDDWVETPWNFENWYLDEPGYRVEEFLYTPPGN